MKTKINDSKNLPLPTGEGRSCSRGTRRTNSGEGASRNAFTLAGGRSPLLNGDEGAQGSPNLVIELERVHPVRAKI